MLMHEQFQSHHVLALVLGYRYLSRCERSAVIDQFEKDGIAIAHPLPKFKAQTEESARFGSNIIE